jgi:hypothetical protein
MLRHLDCGKKSAETKFFIHTPLESPSHEIRLLRFTEGEPANTDTVRLEITTWLIAEAPEYNAISYTWGVENDLDILRIDCKPFAVRKNCHFTLRQVRQHWPKNYVWIDSICINQDDVREKSAQVKRMAQIYAEAKMVLICVGPHENGSERLHKYADELGLINERLISGDMVDDDVEEDDFLYDRLRPVWESTMGQDYVDQALKSIVPFVHRSYWTRLWIVQEVAAGKLKIVLCGGDVLRWESMNLFYEIANHSTHFNTVLHLARPKSMALEHAIRYFGEFGCADARDRLYGILGLVDWDKEKMEEPTADYNIEAFDLLVQVIEGKSFHVSDLFKAMNLFKVTAATVRMQDLIREARGMSPNKSRVPFSQPRTSIETQNVGLSSCHQCQMRMSSTGDLTANFSRGEPENFFLDIQADYSIYPWRAGKLPVFAQPVYSGTTLAVLVCVEAREGDVLISSSPHRPDILLVIRHSDEDNYIIIGQALSVNGYHITTDDKYLGSTLRVRLTALEVVLLWGQDYQAVDDRGYAIYDPEAQLQRLQTDIVFSPESRVQVFLQRPQKKAVE